MPRQSQNERNTVSNRALRTLQKVMYQQDDYGMDKYQEPLDHRYHYDWLQMALQEEADKMKYLQCEMDRKQEVINLLKEATTETDRVYSMVLVETALALLTLGGRENK